MAWPISRSASALPVGLLCAGLLANQAHAADKVTFVTDFGFNGRHAYYFVAQEKGCYQDRGLEVEFVRGQGSADAIKQVGAGGADLGFADAGTLVLARGNDEIPVKLVAIVYAKPPHAIYALEESGIREPADLEGKRVADTAFSAVPALFEAYAQAAGIDADQVTWTVADSAALPSLLATGRVEAVGQYVVGEPLLEKNVAPKSLVRLGYADVGLSYYGNGVIATEDSIQNRPELVRAFVAGTICGMEAAFADPAEAGRIMHEYHRQVEPDIGAGETEAVRDLAEVDGRPLGAIDPERIESTVELVSNAYDLKTPVAPEDMYVPGFVPE